MSPETQREAVVQTVAAVPAAVAVISVRILGLTPEQWLSILGIGFLFLQILYLAWRWRRDVVNAAREDAKFERQQHAPE